MEGANTRRETDVVKNDLQCKVRNNDLSIKITELDNREVASITELHESRV